MLATVAYGLLLKLYTAVLGVANALQNIQAGSLNCKKYSTSSKMCCIYGACKEQSNHTKEGTCSLQLGKKC